MMWGQLCSVGNPAPVRAITLQSRWAPNTIMTFYQYAAGFYDPTLYPAATPVLNQRGEVIVTGSSGGIPASNYFSACFRQPNDLQAQAYFDAWRLANAAPTPGHVPADCQANPSVCVPLPACPLTDIKGNPYIKRDADGTETAQWQNQDLVKLDNSRRHQCWLHGIHVSERYAESRCWADTPIRPMQPAHAMIGLEPKIGRSFWVFRGT